MKIPWVRAGIMSQHRGQLCWVLKDISSFIRQKGHMSRVREEQNSLPSFSVTKAVGVICFGEGNSEVSEMRLERFRD